MSGRSLSSLLYGKWGTHWFYSGAAKSFYNMYSMVMLRDATWQEPLFESITAKPHDRILSLGYGNSEVAMELAHRFPQAVITAVDPNVTAVERGKRNIARTHTTNVTFLQISSMQQLPVDAGSFDKVVLVLTLHDKVPDIKLQIIKEMYRILRRGGTLHMMEYDKPEIGRERMVLRLATSVSGQAAILPHVDGSWTEFLAKGGFARVRRQSSHTVTIGRVVVVRAEKRW